MKNKLKYPKQKNKKIIYVRDENLEFFLSIKKRSEVFNTLMKDMRNGVYLNYLKKKQGGKI